MTHRHKEKRGDANIKPLARQGPIITTDSSEAYIPPVVRKSRGGEGSPDFQVSSLRGVPKSGPRNWADAKTSYQRDSKGESSGGGGRGAISHLTRTRIQHNEKSLRGETEVKCRGGNIILLACA